MKGWKVSVRPWVRLHVMLSYFVFRYVKSFFGCLYTENRHASATGNVAPLLVIKGYLSDRWEHLTLLICPICVPFKANVMRLGLIWSIPQISILGSTWVSVVAYYVAVAKYSKNLHSIDRYQMIHHWAFPLRATMSITSAFYVHIHSRDWIVVAVAATFFSQNRGQSKPLAKNVHKLWLEIHPSWWTMSRKKVCVYYKEKT